MISYQKTFETVMAFLVFAVNKSSQVLLEYKKIILCIVLLSVIFFNPALMKWIVEASKLLILLFSDIPKEFYSLITGICLGGFITLLYKDRKQEVLSSPINGGGMLFDPVTMQPVTGKTNGENLNPFHTDANMEDEVFDEAAEGSEWEVRRKFKQLADDGYFHRDQTMELFKRGVILTKEA